jgi:hypothetical protein
MTKDRRLRYVRFITRISLNAKCAVAGDGEELNIGLIFTVNKAASRCHHVYPAILWRQLWLMHFGWRIWLLNVETVANLPW